MSINSISSSQSQTLLTSLAQTLATSSVSNSSTAQTNPFASLNLTTAQQNKISQILQNAQKEGLSQSQVQSEINNVLTPAQQQQLQNDLSSKSHHHHHRGGSSSSNTSEASETDPFGIPYSSPTAQVSDPISTIAATFSAQQQTQQQQGNL
jgi:Spy/CpxP family protein refolding chaperone